MSGCAVIAIDRWPLPGDCPVSRRISWPQQGFEDFDLVSGEPDRLQIRGGIEGRDPVAQCRYAVGQLALQVLRLGGGLVMFPPGLLVGVVDPAVA